MQYVYSHIVFIQAIRQKIKKYITRLIQNHIGEEQQHERI